MKYVQVLIRNAVETSSLNTGFRITTDYKRIAKKAIRGESQVPVHLNICTTIQKFCPQLTTITPDFNAG